MESCSLASELRSVTAGARANGQRIALVPTMGNLHAGHVSLVRRARELADFVVATIFVNPFQFSAGEDFAGYPRTLDADRAILARESLDLLYLPAIDEVYPYGAEKSTRVEVPALGDILCGTSRPAFFRGVTTVVNILLNSVSPDVALFGCKDYQQLLIIRRMVSDLRMSVEIVGVPTTREPDGLAMSSRNSYLTTAERIKAPLLYRLLREAAESLRAGDRDFPSIGFHGMQALEAGGFRPDYFSVRRADDLLPPADGDERLVLMAAAWLGRARLIDNLMLG